MRDRISITCGCLIYRSRDWLTFFLDGVCSARNARTQSVLHIVANDPTPDVAADPRVSLIHRNPDPEEYYMRRVYRALNRLVETAPTDLIVLLNSDMIVSDYWLDELYALYLEFDGRVAATSLLVESGRLRSAIPEYVRDFGRTKHTFDWFGWRTHAARLRDEHVGWADGRLFGPLLIHREVFRKAGGYPIGNVSGVGTGDRVFFDCLAAMGYPHRMALRSVVYHVQIGEQEDV